MFLGSVSMVVQCYGFINDVTPFLTYFMSIGVTFILGASASDVMKMWKVDSTTINNNTREEYKEEKTETKKIEIYESVKQHIYEEGENAPPIKPFACNACGDEDEGEFNDFR